MKEEKRRHIRLSWEHVLVNFWDILLPVQPRSYPSLEIKINKKKKTVWKAVEIGRFCHNMHKQEILFYPAPKRVIYDLMTEQARLEICKWRQPLFFYSISPKHIIKFTKILSRKKILALYVIVCSRRLTRRNIFM